MRRITQYPQSASTPMIRFSSIALISLASLATVLPLEAQLPASERIVADTRILTHREQAPLVR